MPVKGFVDPDQHRVCFRCRKWFEPDEGGDVDVGATTGASAATNVIGAFIPMNILGGGQARFVCHKCQRRRRRFQFILYGTFPVLVLLVFILQALKLI